LTLVVALAATTGALTAGADELPPWAYVGNPTTSRPVAPLAVPDLIPKHVPGSEVELTVAQVSDPYNVPDWHPDEHPVMPDVVAHGRKPGVFACAYCHLPNGQGHPMNSSLAGLPATYIRQQMADFKSGARRSAVPNTMGPAMMIEVAANVAEDDVLAAANYFASLKFKPWVKVVEADSAPRTRLEPGMLVAVKNGAREPLGSRMVEVPEDQARTQLRDSQSGFVAYVPKGSIKRGEALVATGGGKTTPCAVCHGVALRGLGTAPPLAGRSPTTTARELYDIKAGTRNGLGGVLMKGVVANLSEKDVLDIVAYVASRSP
jgi:cytochrome c553